MFGIFPSTFTGLAGNIILSPTAFQRLSKAEAYKLYTSIYEKYEDKDLIISTFITNLEKMDNLGSSTRRNDKSTGNIPERKVKDFQPIFPKLEVKNLVIGSSLVKRIVDDIAYLLTLVSTHILDQLVNIAFRRSTFNNN